MKITIHTDGASRGNPGLAGAGAWIQVQASTTKEKEKATDSKTVELASFLGEKTNNEAEYLALLLALDWLQRQKFAAEAKVVINSDSKLAVNQLNQKWKVKKQHLQQLVSRCQQILHQLPYPVQFKHVKREFNSQADHLANLAIDLHL
jgi:ribonuclease HI